MGPAGDGIAGQFLPSLTLGLICLSPDAIWDFAKNELVVSGPNGTAGIFATYPSGHLDMVNGFFDQVWARELGTQGRIKLLSCSWVAGGRDSLSTAGFLSSGLGDTYLTIMAAGTYKTGIGIFSQFSRESLLLHHNLAPLLERAEYGKC